MSNIPSTVDILLEARDILAGAEELGYSVPAMQCSLITRSPCVEAAVASVVDARDIYETDRWGYLPNVPELGGAERALLSTSPLPGTLVFTISDDLCCRLGPVEAKRVAVEWLDNAAAWAKDEGAE